MMNPPYSAGQSSANDNNQNLKYPKLDARIEATYAKRSTGTNKNSLYDSYFRALRWATDRIGDEGVIAFVSNSSFIDGNTADGVRLTWHDEFSDIYVYNLKGNQRTQGERSRQEGGKIFGSGSRTGVAITLLVKISRERHHTNVMYAEVADYLSRQEKLDVLKAEHDVLGTGFNKITPNEQGDWLNQRDEKYLEYQEIGDKATKGKANTPAIFEQYSRGLETSRDAWCYNFSREAVAENMQRMIGNYNAEVATAHTSKDSNMSGRSVAWTRKLKKELDQKKRHDFTETAINLSFYRPFCKQSVYFERSMNEYVNQLPKIFPTPQQPNLGICIDSDTVKAGAGLMADRLPDLHMVGTNQCFPLYTWHPITKDNDGFDLESLAQTSDAPEQFTGSFDFSRTIGSQVPLEIGEYRRRENITDATLASYRAHYKDAQNPKGERISKEDIFFYVYALLHHPEYREKYEADLKKMLPRIPKAADFWSYANIGRELADLHVNYESVEAYPGVIPQWAMVLPDDEWAKYHVEKLAWGKRARSATTGRHKDTKDYSTLVYNGFLKFTGIPVEANDYKIGGNSPLEWLIDRYQFTKDTRKGSGIVNDPNDYCREVEDPAYIANLVPRLVTVSMRTQSLIRSLPELVIEEE
ncbi:putative helicase [Arcanobacterium pluranimalium]|nr:putative helicase [Arcanobacterium pluranimalium]